MHSRRERAGAEQRSNSPATRASSERGSDPTLSLDHPNKNVSRHSSPGVRSPSSTNRRDLLHPKDYNDNISTDVQNNVSDACMTFDISPDQKDKAKVIAQKVAAGVPSITSPDVINELDPSRSDLADAIYCTSDLITDRCQRLIESDNGHGGAQRYLHIWSAIEKDGVDRIVEASASVLRYLFFLSLLAAEDVVQWSEVDFTSSHTGKSASCGI
jgi:hypothetical protein